MFQFFSTLVAAEGTHGSFEASGFESDGTKLLFTTFSYGVPTTTAVSITSKIAWKKHQTGKISTTKHGFIALNEGEPLHIVCSVFDTSASFTSRLFKDQVK